MIRAAAWRNAGGRPRRWIGRNPDPTVAGGAGAVIAGESPCSNSSNPGMRTSASSLLRLNGVLKSIHADRGLAAFQTEFSAGTSVLTNCKSRSWASVDAVSFVFGES